MRRHLCSILAGAFFLLLFAGSGPKARTVKDGPSDLDRSENGVYAFAVLNTEDETIHVDALEETADRFAAVVRTVPASTPSQEGEVIRHVLDEPLAIPAGESGVVVALVSPTQEGWWTLHVKACVAEDICYDDGKIGGTAYPDGWSGTFPPADPDDVDPRMAAFARDFPGHGLELLEQYASEDELTWTTEPSYAAALTSRLVEEALVYRIEGDCYGMLGRGPDLAAAWSVCWDEDGIDRFQIIGAYENL